VSPELRALPARIRALRAAGGNPGCMSRSYMSRIESGAGTPSLAALERIAGALGIELHDMFSSEHPQRLLLAVAAARDRFLMTVLREMKPMTLPQRARVLGTVWRIAGKFEEER